MSYELDVTTEIKIEGNEVMWNLIIHNKRFLSHKFLRNDSITLFGYQLRIAFFFVFTHKFFTHIIYQQ